VWSVEALVIIQYESEVLLQAVPVCQSIKAVRKSGNEQRFVMVVDLSRTQGVGDPAVPKSVLSRKESHAAFLRTKSDPSERTPSDSYLRAYGCELPEC